MTEDNTNNISGILADGGILNNLDMSSQTTTVGIVDLGCNEQSNSRSPRTDNMYMANVMATEMTTGNKPRRPSTRALLEVEAEIEHDDNYGMVLDEHKIQCDNDTPGVINEIDPGGRDGQIYSVDSNDTFEPPFEDVPNVEVDDAVFTQDTDLRVDHSCLRTPSPAVVVFTDLENTVKDKHKFYDECVIQDCSEISSSVPDSRPGSSPRLGNLDWRPVMPGYKDTTGNRSFFLKRTVEVNTYDGSLRDAIPSMPKLIAVICLVFNIVIPGTGTFLAGVSVLCCATVRGGGGRLSVIWINCCVMLLQIITTPLFLLGWIWSILWGLSFLAFAEPYWCRCILPGCNGNEADPEAEGSDTTVRRFQRQTSATTTTVTTTLEIPENTTAVNEQPTGDDTPARHVEQPIIVLQEAPVIVTSDNLHFHTHEPSMLHQQGGVNTRRQSLVTTTRHQRAMRRHTIGDVQSMLLNPAALENIISRNGVIPSVFRSGNNYIYEEAEGSPKLG